MSNRVLLLSALGMVGVAGAAPAAEVWRSNLDGNATAIVGTNGVPVNLPQPTADKNGNVGGAVLFDGTNYFSISKQISSFTAGSMSFWARADNLAGEIAPVAIGASGGGTDQYFIVQNEGGTGERWRADVDDGVARLDVFSNAATPLGVWQHVAATFTIGGSLRMYVDGVLQTDVQALNATTLVPTHDWLIGAERAIDPTNNRRFVGAVDDVRIYNHELTQQEVDALFGAGPAYVPEPSALAWLALGGTAVLRRRRTASV